jgi:hypothetical protein
MVVGMESTRFLIQAEPDGGGGGRQLEGSKLLSEIAAELGLSVVLSGKSRAGHATLYLERDAIEQLAGIDDPSGAVGRVRKPPDDRQGDFIVARCAPISSPAPFQTGRSDRCSYGCGAASCPAGPISVRRPEACAATV